MNIVCATDDNFVQHCTIMLVSLLKNNKDVAIYILTEGLTSYNENIIRSEISKYRVPLKFCIVDTSIISKFPMPDVEGLNHISRATYYRLLIADVLPQSLDKVIYLDCDMIINSSIKELWKVNIDNYALAASLQIGCGYEAERLKYPIEYGYFNAGMNVINLNYFRENNISEKLINYITNNYSTIKYHDQDALNGVLYDKTLHVNPQWNMTSILYEPQLKKRGDRINGSLVNAYTDEKKNALEYLKHPIILHYVSRPKPWQNGCTHPLYKLYFKYANQTLNYNNLKPQSLYKRLPFIIRHWIRQNLSIIKQFFFRTDRTRY